MELQYSSLISSSNLMAYWRLNSSLTDDSDNSYDLSVTGTVNDATGIFSGCKDLAGGYMTNASFPNFLSTDDYTLGCWVNLDTLQYSSLISKQDGATRNFELAIKADGAVFLSNAIGASYVETGAGLITTGAWYFIVGTMDEADSGTLKIYINGALIATQTGVGNNGNPTSSLFVGAQGPSGAGGILDGKIDDVFIFDRNLSASDIFALWAHRVSKSESIEVSESVSRLLELGTMSFSESISTSDSVNGTLIGFIGEEENISVSEFNDTTVREGNDVNISIWKDAVKVTDVTGFPTDIEGTLTEGVEIGEYVSIKIIDETNSGYKPSFRVDI